MAKQSKYTLLIICEGQNTEPQFFGSIRDRIIDGVYPVGDIEITIWPEPKEEEEDAVDNADEATSDKESISKPKRKSRAVLPANRPLVPEITGRPPLKWVRAGQEQLREGIFNEVWVVFDDDNHPAKQQAFETSEEEIDGKRVQIAYSSIAFEYYILLHFERINYSFEKSECRIGKKVLDCSIGSHAQDCYGQRCVGGYARDKKYWTTSKGNKSLFPLVEDKLELGFWNAAWLRYQSDLAHAVTPFYCRNPYITTDSIVKRLTGYGDHLYEIAGFNVDVDLKNGVRICFLTDLSVRVTNTSKASLVIPAQCISRRIAGVADLELLGNRTVLKLGETIHLSFAPQADDVRESGYCFRYLDAQVLLQG